MISLNLCIGSRNQPHFRFVILNRQVGQWLGPSLFPSTTNMSLKGEEFHGE